MRIKNPWYLPKSHIFIPHFGTYRHKITWYFPKSHFFLAHFGKDRKLFTFSPAALLLCRVVYKNHLHGTTIWEVGGVFKMLKLYHSRVSIPSLLLYLFQNFLGENLLSGWNCMSVVLMSFSLYTGQIFSTCTLVYPSRYQMKFFITRPRGSKAS